MNAIEEKGSLATLEFLIDWQSDIGRHRERFYGKRVNFWRDVLHDEVRALLRGRQRGDELRISLSSDDIFPFDHEKAFTVSPSQFERKTVKGRLLQPRFGRFYPCGLLQGIRNLFKANTRPFRCIGVDPLGMTIDMNHPLAGRSVDLQVVVHDVARKRREVGGQMNDWMSIIGDGPGMQMRWNGKPTDFFSDQPFQRADEGRDLDFYETPRLVSHIDDQAVEHVRSIYEEVLRPGMRVLDLMSSWGSHLPPELELEFVTGLGLNEEELKQNTRLSSYVIHDVNEKPELPFADRSFDAIICTVSVEYMTRPLEVFADCARILKPDGILVHTFSHRWFPPKVIYIWEELSEFERMGLVLEYFLRTGAYDKIATRSFRGWPRPPTDRYCPSVKIADPVFAVAGRKRSRDGQTAAHISREGLSDSVGQIITASRQPVW